MSFFLLLFHIGWLCKHYNFQTCSHLRASRFLNFLGEHATRLPRLRGLTAPCSYSQLLFSYQLPTAVLQILLKPLQVYVIVYVGLTCLATFLVSFMYRHSTCTIHCTAYICTMCLDYTMVLYTYICKYSKWIISLEFFLIHCSLLLFKAF